MFSEMLEGKMALVRGKEERVWELEREIADLLARNNVLLNEKQRMAENEQVQRESWRKKRERGEREIKRER